MNHNIQISLSIFLKKLNWEKRIKLRFVKLIQINPILMLLIFSGN